ncbi:unnamed protein product [Prorocentrum cordatum]|uniref:Uncharacterized protein n=1 Tax=Prorocentrum cordatum TaxID=2364126 RepID=A0ABN9TS58_9DINO|nr:unnamed protein product [Polarella glacialis]
MCNARSSGRLNMEMLGKFEKTAQEWLHSRVAFAKIDTDRDKAMAEKWINPHMVPTNIMFRDGEGVPVDDVGDFERLKSEFHANPEGQRWWLTKYLGDDPEGTNLHYVAPAKTAKSLKRALKRSSVTLVAFLEAAKGDAWEAFHELAWSAHQPGGAAAADGRRLEAAALGLGFAAAAGRVDKSVTAPAIVL